MGDFPRKADGELMWTSGLSRVAVEDPESEARGVGRQSTRL
jgi:hypothetical protein